jgi:hypothetical protein
MLVRLESAFIRGLAAVQFLPDAEPASTLSILSGARHAVALLWPCLHSVGDVGSEHIVSKVYLP